MSPRLRLSLRALRVSRAIHTTPSAFASDPDLPPARKTAEDLGFTGNKGRLRDLSKLSIPTSGRSHIASLGKPTRVSLNRRLFEKGELTVSEIDRS